MTDPILQS